MPRGAPPRMSSRQSKKLQSFSTDPKNLPLEARMRSPGADFQRLRQRRDSTHVLEDFVREVVDALALWRHSVEQAAGVDAAGQVTVSALKWPST